MRDLAVAVSIAVNRDYLTPVHDLESVDVSDLTRLIEGISKWLDANTLVYSEF